MKIVDRYLLRQFLKTFLICFLSLTGLFIIFDAFTNLEYFLRAAEKTGGLGALMGRYYAFRSVMFFDRTSNLLTLVAAMFTITWIQRHNELTALMAAGVSRARVVKPIIVAAVVLSLLSTVVREVAIPQMGRELSRSPQDLLGDAAHELKPAFDDQTQVCIRGKNSFNREMRIEEPNFWLPQELGGGELTAVNAYYRAPAVGKPGGYLLDDVKSPKDLDKSSNLMLCGQPVVYTHKDADDWLKPGQCFVVSGISFEQLVSGQTFRQYFSTVQLIRSLHNESLGYGADVRVAVHCRIVQPFLDITLLFLGMPLVISRENRNVFLAIGLFAVLVSLFLMVGIAFQQLGETYIRPATAAWAPLLIFVPLAVRSSESMWR